MIPRLALLIMLLVARAAADPLDVLPARYLAVGGFTGPDAPLFGFWRTMPGGAPPCVEKVLGKADGYIQAQVPKVKASLLVFRGKLERAAVEQCVRDVLDRIASPHPRVTPQGALTRVETDTTTFFLGWAKDGSVIEAREQADVEEVLARKTKPSPDLLAIVARVDRTKGLWMAGALDYGTPLLGVPSMGYFASLDPAALKATAKAKGVESLQALVTLVFPSAADAKKAALAVAGAARKPRFSAALQAQLGKLDAHVRGADLVVDLAPLFGKPELFAEMTQAMTEIATH